MYATLYISYDGMTDPLGPSQILPYLKGLSKSGFRIILISFEKDKDSSEADKIKDELCSAGIIWKPLQYHKRPTIPATLFDLLIGTFFTLFYCKKYDIRLVHCRGHYLTSLMAYLISPFHNYKYIFDMRGFWADERVEGDLWDLKHSIYRYQYRFFKEMEKKFLERADQVITLTHVAKRHIEQHFLLKNEVVVIPCSTDLQLFSFTPGLQDNSLRRAKRECKFVLLYLGSLGTWYMLEEMLLFFQLLKQSRPSVFFFITTDSPDYIINLAKELGIDENELFVRRAVRKEIPQLISAADAGIFFIKPVFSKTGSSPTKHAEMMGCQLPIVTNAGIGDLDSIISKSNTGVVLQDFKPETMRQGIDKLLSLTKENDRSRYRFTAERIYSLNLAIDKYIKIYSKLLHE